MISVNMFALKLFESSCVTLTMLSVVLLLGKKAVWCGLRMLCLIVNVMSLCVMSLSNIFEMVGESVMGLYDVMSVRSLFAFGIMLTVDVLKAVGMYDVRKMLLYMCSSL